MAFDIIIRNRYRIASLAVRPARYHHTDPVVRAGLYLIPIDAQQARAPFVALTYGSATDRSDETGRADLNLPDKNGTYMLRVLPEYWTLDTVGPTLARSFTSLKGRIYRPLDVKLRIEGNPGNARIATAVTANGSDSGVIWKLTATTLELLLQPVWMTDHGAVRKTRTSIDMIIVHQTAGSQPYGAVSSMASKAGAHYLILKKDGQIVKFLDELAIGGHAGPGDRRPLKSHWAGATDINNRSIGIELENVEAWKDNSDYSEPQYKSLIRLLGDLVAHYGIDPKRIIGHSDVATELKIKYFDPGLKFDWPRLDREGFGLTGPGRGYPSLRSLMAAGPAAVGNVAYGGLFKGADDDPELRMGDNDRASIYGGRRRDGVTGSPIREMLTDLEQIGYWVGQGSRDGRLDDDGMRAVMHFQHHFFAMERTTMPSSEGNVRLDCETAMRIRDVAAMN
jgi:N-acetyl-anhydromuramyl-L-alanine amidase AmpD